MLLFDLPADLFEYLLDEIVDSTPVCSMLRLRLVNKSFNDAILSCMFARVTHYAIMREYVELLPFMSKFIHTKYQAGVGPNSQLFSAMQQSIDFIEKLKSEKDPPEKVSAQERERYITVLCKSSAQRLYMIDVLHLLSSDDRFNLTDVECRHGALVALSSTGETELMGKIINMGVDLKRESAFFSSALTAAIINNREYAAFVLLSRGASDAFVGIWNPPCDRAGTRTRMYYPRLNLACRCGHENLVRLLLQPTYDHGRNHLSSDAFWGAMKEAQRRGFTKVVLAMKEEWQRDRSTFLLRLLRTSAEYGNHELAESLLKEGGFTKGTFKHNSLPSLVLSKAITSRNHSVIKLLMDQGYEFDEDCLCAAAEIGDEDLAKTILEAGVSINPSGRNGWEDTPIGWAICHGQSNMVRFLLSHGAHFDAVNGGPGILQEYIAHGNPSIVRAVIATGVDPNVLPAAITPIWYEGCSEFPLATAISHGHDHVADVLRELGARELGTVMMNEALEKRATIVKAVKDDFPGLEVVKRASEVLGLQRREKGQMHSELMAVHYLSNDFMLR